MNIPLRSWLGVLLLVTVTLVSPSRAAALVEPFNPVSIITDEEFNDSYAMSCSDIQDFLNQRTGILKSYVLDGKPAARIICEQSNRFGVNPKLILVLLQKEQGLLAESQPSSDAFDWATGCAPGYDEAKGFANQVECSARTLRSRFDTVPLGAVTDGVIPLNRASTALYRYNNTQSGNQDFWTIWTHYWPHSAAAPPPAEILVEAQVMETTPAVGDTCKTGWVTGGTGLKGYHLLTPNASGAGDSTNSAVWRPNIPRTGAYQVQVYIPDHPGYAWPCGGLKLSWDTDHAQYSIKHRDGVTSYEVDQAPLSNAWVNIGTYYFNKGTDDYVTLSDMTGEPAMSRYVNFDSVKFTWVAP
ncbi:MAG TPA: hypothetical protein VGK81_04630 [Anaerolineae bacterium]|jgi:hypothetical protein